MPHNLQNSPRNRFPRNRTVSFTPAHVITDGFGHILERPLVRNPELPCFGRPEEYWRGISDVQWRTRASDGTITESAWGCAGCGVRAACGKVALERKDSSPKLKALFDTWEAATACQLVEDRYRCPSWAAFERACIEHSWDDSHEGALVRDKNKRAERERRRRKTTRRTRRKRRAIDPNMLHAIDLERQVRAGALRKLRITPGAPRWIARRNDAECDRVADVWKFREIIEKQRVRVTGKAIAELMIQNQCGGSGSLGSLTSRVLEILPRLEDLEGTDGLDPMRPWRPFTPLPPKKPALAGAVTVLIDDDLDDYDDECTP